MKKAAAANATVDKAEAATAETEDALVRLAFGRLSSWKCGRYSRRARVALAHPSTVERVDRQSKLAG